MNKRDEIYSVSTAFKDLSIAFRYVTITYLSYLILPPLILIRYSETICVFQELLGANPSNAEALIPVILSYHLLYGGVFTFSLIALSIAIIYCARKFKNLAKELELQLPSKLAIAPMIWGIYAITLATINIFYTYTQYMNLINQLWKSIESGTMEMTINPEPLRTMVIVHEILFAITIILLSWAIHELVENFEILDKLRLPAQLLLVGASLFIIEVLLWGLGIGPIIVVIAFYMIKRGTKEVSERLKNN